VESTRIAASLREARTRIGWSRETLAHHSGVSWSAIAQIESGRRKDVRLSSLAALARALQVSVDYLIGPTAPAPPPLLEHRVLGYRSDDDYLAGAVPYLEEGIERGHSLLAVTTSAKRELLRQSLGDGSSQVEFTDWTEWYTSPEDALSRYGDYVAEKLAQGAVWIRVLGDAAWSGEPDADIATWTRYESLVNLAFASSPATILCTYDERSFSAAALAQACQTHPELVQAGQTTSSPTYRGPQDLLLHPPSA
jgi:transcriptional regulator with XRE-family HTH domain